MVLCHSSINGELTKDGWKYKGVNSDGRCGIYFIPDEKSPRPVGITFKHNYTDRQGNQHTFNREYKPDGKKVTRWAKPLGIKEIELLPYRWNEVKEAIALQKPIYLIEGELGADELIKLELTATNLRTKPTLETLELFIGSHLVICPDRDETGIKKAIANYEAFKPVAASIKMMLSEPKRWDYIPANGGRDVYDWIVDGCTKEDIEAAIAPFDLAQFLNKPDSDQDDIKSIYERVCEDLDNAIAAKELIDADLVKAKQDYLEVKETPLNPDLGKLKVNYELLKTQAKIASDKVSNLKSKVFGLRVDVNRQAKDERQQRAIEENDPKIFDLLMAIVSELYLFRQDTESGDTYVDVVSNEVRRTYRLRSKDFKSWLCKELYASHAKPANSEALETCLKVCEGLSTENIESVWMRTAECDGKIYFDLCNPLWQAVEISKQGWRVVDSRDLPIRFVRSLMQVELPTPSNQNDLNHSLVRLFELLSIAEESKPLVVGWLLSALVPTGDKPILVLSAPKGSGKSTIAEFLVNLIDHTKASLLPAVGDRRAMAVQAKHRWILAYDNLSHLSTEQQDAMCCASTGAGYIERQLFTDNDVTFVEYPRPQILTSVDLVPTRSDLLDRCQLVKIKPLPECDRKTNEELDQLFTEIHAEVIGGLFDLLVTALSNPAAAVSLWVFCTTRSSFLRSIRGFIGWIWRFI
jgi:RNA-binding protein YhbY